jgi:hypothetical protein
MAHRILQGVVLWIVKHQAARLHLYVVRQV